MEDKDYKEAWERLRKMLMNSARGAKEEIDSAKEMGRISPDDERWAFDYAIANVERRERENWLYYMKRLEEDIEPSKKG